MGLRLVFKSSQDDLHLLSEPHLGYLQSRLVKYETDTLYPWLYFSYNATTQQTTIITTDLNRPHLRMIKHLKGLSGGSIQPEEIGRLMTQCFVVVQDCFRVVARLWDERTTGEVCGGKFHLRLY